MDTQNEEQFDYQVVINDEEQYALWPVFKSVPPGWHGVGVSGSESVCLKHIEEVWTDMRPLSLRKALSAAALGSQESPSTQGESSDT